MATAKELFRFLARPTPFMSWERRWIRQLVLRWQDPRVRDGLYDLLFWIVTAGIAYGGAYLWSSTECAMGRDCLIANGDLANWLLVAK